jgi:GntR family transcriptional regulator, trigonelline degradation regulator
MTENWMLIERNPAPLRSQVVEKLRTAIIEGVYLPGERLIERSLCEALQISRPSLREAIRQLETEGLIENIPNRGPIVRSLSATEAQALCDLCVLVEGLCARYFALHGTEKDIAAFEAALMVFENSFGTGDALAIRRAKHNYYEAFIAGTHSEELQTTLRRLNARLSQCWASSLRQPDRIPQGIGEMRVIVQSIKRRDPEAACLASTLYAQHFSAFVNQVLVQDKVQAPKLAA